MFENVENFSEVLPGLVTLLAALAGWRAGRLAFRPHPARRRSARRVVMLLAAVALLAAVEVVLVVLMGTHGWEFAANRVLVALPPLLVPLTVAAAVSVPRLLRLDADRARASDPWLVVPVQATAVGALLCFLVVFVVRPVPPYPLDVFVVDGVLMATAVLLTVRRRYRLRGTGGPQKRPGLATRALRTVGAVASVAALVIGVGALPAAASRLPDRYDMGTGPVMDYGGGPTALMDGMSLDGTGTSVADLTGDVSGVPDAAFTLTAQQASVRLSSGRVVDVLSFQRRYQMVCVRPQLDFRGITEPWPLTRHTRWV